MEPSPDGRANAPGRDKISGSPGSLRAQLKPAAAGDQGREEESQVNNLRYMQKLS